MEKIINYIKQQRLLKASSKKIEVKKNIIVENQRHYITHTIKDDIRTKQLIWYEHVQRINDEQILKQVLDLETDKKTQTKKIA